MEQRWTRILAVVILSVILPQAVVLIGSRFHAGTVQLPQTSLTQPTTEPSETAGAPQQSAAPVIPVLVAKNRVVGMDLEKYVRGVVLAEMPASFHEEALKAQAVAARTYALRRVAQKDRHPEGAVCMDPNCCQAWVTDEDYLSRPGTQQMWEKIARAVEQTRGEVVLYDNEIAETTYFSCSGGRTESACAVWGWEIPYLQSVSSPGEEAAPVFSAQLLFSEEEFAACLQRTLEGTPQQWLGRVTYTSGGGVERMVIGGMSYSGTQLRRLLGLPSTAFVMTAAPEGILIFTTGKGHRVGMSQYGAHAMAQQGSDYLQILQHYYSGTEIDKIVRIE